MVAVMLLLSNISAVAGGEDEVSSSDRSIGTNITTRALSIGIGATNQLDTYLSPEEYKGADLSFMSVVEYEKEGRLWSREMINEGHLLKADNRSGNGDMLGGGYRFAYSWLRAFNVGVEGLKVKAGVMASLDLGFLYSTRNGNNPVQIKAHVDVAPAVRASYDFRLFRKTMTARWAADVPLLGVMFSPNYGQSYYEISSKGNYDHNVVPTTIGCCPSLHSLLSVDIPMGGGAMRVGYLAEVNQSNVNSLKYHSYNNAFVIGYVKTL